MRFRLLSPVIDRITGTLCTCIRQMQAVGQFPSTRIRIFLKPHFFPYKSTFLSQGNPAPTSFRSQRQQRLPLSYIKQLLEDEVFEISGIIKVSVSVISRAEGQKPNLIIVLRFYVFFNSPCDTLHEECSTNLEPPDRHIPREPCTQP